MTAGAALTTVIVASCLNAPQRHDASASTEDLSEPTSMLETTGASTPPVPTVATAAIPAPPAPSMAVPTVIVQRVVTAPPAPAVVPAPEVATETAETTAAAIRPVQAAPPAIIVAPTAPAPTTTAPTTTGTPEQVAEAQAARAARRAARDAAQNGQPQQPVAPAVPPPVVGAGRFSTDAPPNAGSSFQENAEAGAGAFPGPQ